MKVNFQKLHSWLNSLCLVALTAIVVTISIFVYDQFSTGDCSDDYRQELELDYWHTKSEIVDEVDGYIKSHAPGSDLSAITLVNACEEAKIDIKFVLVQGLMESHFGTKGLAAKTNCVWNIGAYDGYTADQISSKWKFDHPDHSVRPYLDHLNRRYLSNGRTEIDLLESFTDIDGNRYASYTKYEQELTIKYNELQGSRLDSLLTVRHKQKLRLNR